MPPFHLWRLKEKEKEKEIKVEKVIISTLKQHWIIRCKWNLNLKTRLKTIYAKNNETLRNLSIISELELGCQD